jgi:tRNA-2-methylthio-N6-dimethylallyladenosine synthase
MTDTTSEPTADSGRQKVFIKTYGCQMNVYDSERMGDALAREGFDATQEMGEADLIVLNTCHIREKAVEKVYSALGRVRKVQEARRHSGLETMVAVTGCVAQAEGGEIRSRVPMVDVVAGPQSYHRIGEYLREARAGRPVVATGFEIEEKFKTLPPARRRGFAPGGAGARGSPQARRRRRARDHAARSERQCLAWGGRQRRDAPRGTAGSAFWDRWHRPAQIHHQPSHRHG